MNTTLKFSKHLYGFLTNDNTMKVAAALTTKEQTVTQIHIQTRIVQPTVSSILRRLLKYNLVISRRDGKEVYYKWNGQNLDMVERYAYELHDQLFVDNFRPKKKSLRVA